MTTSRDPDRLIHAFVREGAEQLDDQVYDAVRAEIDQKRQRVVIGPWRVPNMSKLVPYRPRRRRPDRRSSSSVASSSVRAADVTGSARLPRLSPRRSPSTTPPGGIVDRHYGGF